MRGRTSQWKKPEISASEEVRPKKRQPTSDRDDERKEEAGEELNLEPRRHLVRHRKRTWLCLALEERLPVRARSRAVASKVGRAKGSM